MTFYHFTSGQHLALILSPKSKGICMGVVPHKILRGKPTFFRNWQWLTVNPDFDQTWDRDGFRPPGLPYRRTEHRIRLEITGPLLARVVSFEKYLEHRRCEAELFLKTGTDWKNWYLFSGPIPPNWFLDVLRNPTPIHLTFE